MFWRGRGIQVVLATVFLLVIVTVGLSLRGRSPWRSSPDTPRVGLAPEWDHWEAAHQDQPLQLPELPRVFLDVETHRVEDALFVTRDFQAGPRPRGELTVEKHVAEGKSITLPGGDELSVEAVGVWVPGVEATEYMDPVTLDPVELRGPESFHETDHSNPYRRGLIEVQIDLPDSTPVFHWDRVPILVLLMRGNAATRIDSIQVFDARTQWRLFSGPKSGVNPFNSGYLEKQDLFHVMFPISIWHDTKLAIAVDLPCGTPVLRELALETGEQFTLDSALRYQFAQSGIGRVMMVDRHGEDWRIKSAVAEQFVISRIAPSAWAQQIFLGIPGQPYWMSRPMETMPRFQAVALPRLDADGRELKPVSLTFYPQRARVWFNVSGLPAMPNQKVTNLFNVRFRPQTLDTGWSSLLAKLPPIVELPAGTFPDHLTPTTVDEVIELDEEGMTTPAEILRTYTELHPHMRVRANEALIVEKRPPNWRERLRNAWNDFLDQF